MQNECTAIIQGRDLPAGWALLPVSEMPPIDKTPWWVTNPQVLEGTACKQIDVGGEPSRASRIHASIYEKQECRVTAFCFVYSSADQASTDFRTLTQGEPSDEDFVGFVKGALHTLVVMNIPSDCPDRDFFVQHFKDVADPRLP